MKDFGVVSHLDLVGRQVGSWRMPPEMLPVGKIEFGEVVSHVFKYNGTYVFACSVDFENTFEHPWAWFEVPEKNKKNRYKWIKFGGI